VVVIETKEEPFVCDRRSALLTRLRNAKKAKERPVNPTRAPQTQSTIWQTLPIGSLKCNVDASFSRSHNKVGIKVYILDDQSRFVLTKTKWISPLLDVYIGEQLELLNAINYIKDLHLKCMTS
jgi:hypothetical protein